MNKIVYIVSIYALATFTSGYDFHLSALPSVQSIGSLELPELSNGSITDLFKVLGLSYIDTVASALKLLEETDLDAIRMMVKYSGTSKTSGKQPFWTYSDGTTQAIPSYLLFSSGLSGKLKVMCPMFVSSDVNFYLYTKQNPVTPQLLHEESVLNETVYDASAKTVILIHGWFQEGKSFSEEMKDALLNTESAVNVIAVDWSLYSTCEYLHTTIYLIPRIGELTAQIITNLISYGSSVKSFHVVGHSLGGQIAGHVGKFMAPLKLPRITGLDPAGPWYRLMPSSHRIDKSDAEFVDIIHTNSGMMGMKEQIGHVDFHPNGGMLQPECFPLNVKCSHQQSVKYFTYSILNPDKFCSIKCDKWSDFQRGHCAHEQAYMGYGASSSYSGSYYLHVADEPPYGLGCTQ